jgi:hypothetical protein
MLWCGWQAPANFAVMISKTLTQFRVVPSSLRCLAHMARSGSQCRSRFYLDLHPTASEASPCRFTVRIRFHAHAPSTPIVSRGVQPHACVWFLHTLQSMLTTVAFYTKHHRFSRARRNRSQCPGHLGPFAVRLPAVLAASITHTHLRTNEC